MKTDKLFRITTVPQSLRGLLRGQLRFMNGFYNVTGISSAGEALDEVEKNEGVPVYEVNMTRAITPLQDLKAVWQLYKIFKKEKPLIVHTHTPKAGTVGMLAAKLAGVPHRLHTVAGLPLLVVQGQKRKLLDAVEKFTYSCATKVYPNSYGLLKIIQDQNYTVASKLKVIGNGSSNGINTALFDGALQTEDKKKQLRSELGIKPDDFVFVFVGRLVGDKGINELVAAFRAISSKHENIKLLLVGPFESHLDPLQSQTLNEIESNSNIISVGFQPDVKPYFAISSVLVFPSYREGFPNVVMQAGAMGLPCAVSNINGCNEIIVEGENGIIFPVKNTEAVFEAMQKLITNKELMSKLSQNAREMIVNRYEQQKVWEAILNEYQSLHKS